MKTTVALAVVATLSACSESAPRASGPVIMPVGTSYELVLPDPMMAAIQKTVPGFQMETLAAYDADITTAYRFTSRQAPWAVVGDFDGDGIQDVVADGRVGTDCARLLVWGAATHADTLVGTQGRRCDEPLHTVLLYAPPGEKFSVNDDTDFIFADGYTDYFFEKAGFTWFWQNGQWKSFGSSD